MVSLWNRSKESFEVLPGDRIAQMMFFAVTSPNFKLVSEFDFSERGSKGFGSSGTK
jgi:dUTP pyrophosphatase